MNTLKTMQKKKQNKYPKTRPWYYMVKLSAKLDEPLLEILLDTTAMKAKPSTNSILDSPEAELLAEEYAMDLQSVAQ